MSRALVAALLAGAALISSREARADEVLPRIEGGALAPDKSSAVALCEGPQALGCRAFCGGTLIAPNLVLTARHCGAPTATELDCATYHFDGPLTDPTTVWVTASAVVSEQATFHRGTRWDVPLARACGHDLALLTLEDAISADEATTATPLLEEDAVAAASSALLTIDGYGRTSPDVPSDGARRTRDANLLCFGGRDACSSLAGGPTLLDSELAVDALVCPGDSGSGLCDSSRRVLGALGRSIGGTSPCGYGVYTTFPAHAQLVARVARAASDQMHAPAPAWALATSPTAPFGASCDGDADCASGECRSYDGGLGWSCVTPCDSSCSGTCHDGSCFADAPAVAPGGCSTANAQAEGPFGFALANLVGWALRRWRRA